MEKKEYIEKKSDAKKEYFPMFDYLRFLCCLLIFIYHYDGLCGFGLIFNRSLTLDFIIRNGNECIALFFMLSGFCMASRYSRSIAAGKEPFARYAFGHYKKFLAMILVTFPITVIKSICMYKAGMDTMPNLWGFVLDLLGIRTGYGMHSYFGYNGPLWFINVLFLMYLAYYLVAYKSGSRTVYTVICLFLALFGISQQAMGSFALFVFNSNTYVGMGGFFLGAVLYEVYAYYADSEKQMRKISLLCAGFVVIVLVAIYMNLHFPGIGVLPEDSNLWVNYSLVLTLAFWPSCILILSGIRLPKATNPLTQFLSKLSTSVYIWHWPVIYILNSFVVRGLVTWTMGGTVCNLLAVGLTFGFAIISALFLEKMVLKGIEKFFRKA